MASDFSAKQIRVSQLIASGGIVGAPGTGLAIYSASSATNLTGGVPNGLFSGFSSDVFLFVSGTQDGVTRGEGVTLFGGDVVVSGTLYAEKQIIEVDESVTGSLNVQGSMFISGASEMAGGLDVNNSRGTKGGPGGNDFVYFGSTGREIIAAESSTNQVKILSGGNSGKTPMESNYLDLAFFVSGSIGSRGTSDKGTSIFGGDLYSSGAMYGKDLSISNDLNVGVSLYVSGNTTMGGNIDVDGISNLDNTDIDGTFTMDGTAFDVNATSTLSIDNTNTSNGVTVNTNVSGGPVSIGHTTSVTTINDELDITGTVDINDASDSASKTTGALKVAGGVGIVKDLFVGINLDVDGISNLDNTDIDGTFTMDGTAFDVNATSTLSLDNTNTSNGITVNTNVSQGPVSIGHTTSETTVNDNLNVTGNLLISEFITHTGDADTKIQFEADEITLTAGGTNLLSANNTENTVSINPDGTNGKNFIVKSNNKTAITVHGTNDQVLIHSGGAATSFDEASGDDISYYVSGTLDARNTPTPIGSVKGVSLFGGTLVTSGTFYGLGGISGSITNLSDGRSYIAAGDNITITSASNGQILITGAAGGTSGGGTDNLGWTSPSAGTISTTGSLAVGTEIFHEGDTDTKIQFATDEIKITVGNREFARLTESTNDIIEFNNAESPNFQFIVNNTNGEVITSNNNEVIINEGGMPGTDFRVASNQKTHAIFLDSDNQYVHILADTASTEAGTDVAFFVSGSISDTANDLGNRPQGDLSLIGGDLVVSGALYLGSRIINEGDPNTYIRPRDDRWEFYAGGKHMLKLDESESTISINNDNEALNTVIKTDTKMAIAAGTPLGAGKDQVLFMSGGAATSYNEATANDVLVYFSGSRTGIGGQSAASSGRNSTERGCVVFGGDTVFSGSIYGAGEIAAGNTAIHMSANTLQLDAGSQAAFCDSTGNAPGFGFNNASDTFFSVTGSIGGRGHGTERGVSVFGGDVVVSGSMRAKQIFTTIHYWNGASADDKFIPFQGVNEQSAAQAKYQNAWVPPFNGCLRKIVVRPTVNWNGENSIFFKLHVSPNGSGDVTMPTANIESSLPVTPENQDRKAYTFYFTGSNHFAAEDWVGISFGGASGGGGTNGVNLTAVWELDSFDGSNIHKI